MNIFWLSLNVALCAQYHCDKHVVKMILEYAQLLSTAHHILDGKKEERFNSNGKTLMPKYQHPNTTLYKPTHINHPCSVWTRKTSGNYQILYQLFCTLCDEYTHRYGKIHKTDSKLREILKNVPKNIHIGEMTPPAIAIADKSLKIHSLDGKYYIVESYRNYYNVEKRKFAKWTNREIPDWFKNENSLEILD